MSNNDCAASILSISNLYQLLIFICLYLLIISAKKMVGIGSHDIYHSVTMETLHILKDGNDLLSKLNLQNRIF